MSCICCGMCKRKTDEHKKASLCNAASQVMPEKEQPKINNEKEEETHNILTKCFYISLHDIYIFIKDKVKHKHNTE